MKGGCDGPRLKSLPPDCSEPKVSYFSAFSFHLKKFLGGLSVNESAL